MSLFPISFWFSLACVLAVGCFGWLNRAKGWGYPAMAVCGTVIAWYHGDAFYNDYGDYVEGFTDQLLDEAWMQVALFALAFGIFMGFVPTIFFGKLKSRSSRVDALISGKTGLDALQPSLEKLARVIFWFWLVLLAINIYGSGGDILSVVAPYLAGYGGGMSRGQIATSILDSLTVVVQTLLTLCAAVAGVCAALLRPGTGRNLMIAVIALSWPRFLLDRTRNIMLVVVLPWLISLVFIRWRHRLVLQVAMLAVSFLAINSWFKFVLANRGENGIVEVVMHQELQASMDEDVRHQGFNMFEELCWVNCLTDDGTYTPAWGMLYFANFVNPIPRAIWPNKPTMGLDYAIARGQGVNSEGEATSTVSVGMIGGGIANFGRLYGPVAAAFLMALWCAFLARLDLMGDDYGFLLIYTVGIVGTFNFGRDVNIIAAYPAFFGFGFLWTWRRFHILQNKNALHSPKRYNRLT